MERGTNFGERIYCLKKRDLWGESKEEKRILGKRRPITAQKKEKYKVDLFA